MFTVKHSNETLNFINNKAKEVLKPFHGYPYVSIKFILERAIYLDSVNSKLDTTSSDQPMIQEVSSVSEVLPV